MGLDPQNVNKKQTLTHIIHNDKIRTYEDKLSSN